MPRFQHRRHLLFGQIRHIFHASIFSPARVEKLWQKVLSVESVSKTKAILLGINV